MKLTTRIRAVGLSFMMTIFCHEVGRTSPKKNLATPAGSQVNALDCYLIPSVRYGIHSFTEVFQFRYSLAHRLVTILVGI